MSKKFTLGRSATSLLLVLAILFSSLGIMPVAVAAAPPAPWSFGVMGDTQWTCPTDPDGTNPGGVSASIIKQLNDQFIGKDVKFVIQVGDLINGTPTADLTERAKAAQSLYDAGIGFFPMRGNHEFYNDLTNYNVTKMQTLFPQNQGLGTNTFGATDFSSPTSVSSDLNGLSYSFNYNNATFVILDVMATPSKHANIAPANVYENGYTIADQQAWIDSQLDKSTRGTEQAFVFSHSNLIGENHYETVFTGYADDNKAAQNAFFATLQGNDVKYFISGHEHLGERSIITSPDGNSSVEQLIAAPACPKFSPALDPTLPKWHGQKTRQTVLSRELNTLGYYIYTVDGSRVTVDYYTDDNGGLGWQSDANWPTGPGPNNQKTPTFNFTKKATWGYDLNGTTKQKAKNVIVMVSDGMGFNTMLAADYYQHGETGDQVYQNFPTKLAVSTYEYEAVSNPYPYAYTPPIVSQNPLYTVYGYDSTLAWSDFNYVSWMVSDPALAAYNNNSTDSSSSATAMACGVKTKDGYVGVDINQNIVKNIVEYAEELGKATGVVTTVPLSHATPAGWSTHLNDRNAYKILANQMIYGSALDVIMGCGAPDFNADGVAVAGPYTESASKYVGGVATWNDISDGSVTGADANADGSPDNWSVIRTRSEFQAMATGATPDRVLGIPQVNQTLQYYRGGNGKADAYVVPLTPNLPTLADMSKAALNVLDNNPNGFFVMIEGGAVDWSGHFYQPGRLVEEQIDFNNAVLAVTQWVETNSSWDDTLLIITADHETGYVWGPGSGTDPAELWKPVVNNGTGVMPGLGFYSVIGSGATAFGWHTNSLVPLFAKGAGSSMFASLADETDPVRGAYIDNTEYLKVMKTAMTPETGPQTWQLDSETSPAGFQMERTHGPGDDGQTGEVSILSGKALTWIADEAAVSGVTFPSGAWKIEIATESDWGTNGSNCLATFGIWNGSAYTPFSTLNLVSVGWSAGSVAYAFKLDKQLGSITIPTGSYLAVQITNNDSKKHTIYTDESEKASCVTSPQTDPGYPLPELAAGVLLGTGLLGMALFVAIRRRKTGLVKVQFNNVI